MRLDDGWFEFESDIWSQVGDEYANINAGETYTVTGSFNPSGTQVSSQLYVHYYDVNDTQLGGPVLLVDSSDATSNTPFVVTLLPPPDTAKLKFASTVHMQTGSATYNLSEISRRQPGSSIQRSTYYLAGKAIATRINGTTNDDGLYFFHSDHLGSATVMSYGQGHASVGQTVADSVTRYLPFGDYRTAPQTELTELGYTGHHENRGLGLTYMNARFYVGYIYRFASADTIVPDPTNPQSYNRYSYVNNNPIGYSDPTGHFSFDQIAALMGYDLLAHYDENGDWLTGGRILQDRYNNGELLEWQEAWVTALRGADFGDVVLIGTDSNSECNCLYELMFVAEHPEYPLYDISGINAENKGRANVKMLDLQGLTILNDLETMNMFAFSTWAIFENQGGFFDAFQYNELTNTSYHEAPNGVRNYDYGYSPQNRVHDTSISMDAVYEAATTSLVVNIAETLGDPPGSYILGPHNQFQWIPTAYGFEENEDY